VSKNPRSHWLTGALTLLILLFAARTPAAQLSPDAAGIRAANAWLNLVDQREYAQSWQEASSLFRDQVTEGSWENRVSEARTQVGPLHSRNLESPKKRPHCRVRLTGITLCCNIRAHSPISRTP
jgi:Protein of unknown function (DUF4019)